MHKLNTATVQSAQRRGPCPDYGSRARMPGSGEPQDAASLRKLERGSRCHPREGTITSGLKEPGKDARLHGPSRENPRQTVI